MSAVFNFQSLLVVVLLVICTCAYIRSLYPSILDRNRTGFLGVFWKAARIGKSYMYIYSSLFIFFVSVKTNLCVCVDQGERLSPWVSASCVIMAFSLLFGSK